MRTRPTRLDSSIRFSPRQWIAGTAAVLALCTAGPVLAEAPADSDEATSTSQRVVLTGVDLVIVRPLAVFRAGIGSLLMLPAALLVSPACFVNLAHNADCRPVYEAPYDVLVGEPAEYAFGRPMGEL